MMMSEWKLVPVEPTAEMLAATSWPGCAAKDYEHMLAAAPSPEWCETTDADREAVRIIAVLRAENERLKAERDEARTLVTEANNSLYGSQGYFHSMTGGEFDPHHLSRGIEKLKEQTRIEWQQTEALRARVAELEALLTAICEMQQRNYGHGFDTHIDLSGLCDKARAMLAAAPSPEWVKTSERLPTREDADEEESVWVWTGRRDVYAKFYGDVPHLTDGYWMPKPRQQPPKPPEGE